MKPTHPLSLCAVMYLWSALVAPADSFFQVSLWGPGLQIVGPTQSVRGIRLDIGYGRNADVDGLDLGLANHATGASQSLQLGLVNLTGSDFEGAQWSWVGFSRTGGSLSGWQNGLVSVTGGSVKGLQHGLVNLSGDDVHGLQLSSLGYSRATGDLYGWQNGLASVTRGEATGFQSGLVGITQDSFTGLQIGAGYALSGGELTGAQLGLVSQASQYEGLRTAGSVRGFQLGLITTVEVNLNGVQCGLGHGTVSGEAHGLQLGVVNEAGHAHGLQLGLLNLARQAQGLQLGVVNVTENMKGLQLGLGNVILSKERFQGLPIMNWSY